MVLVEHKKECSYISLLRTFLRYYRLAIFIENGYKSTAVGVREEERCLES